MEAMMGQGAAAPPDREAPLPIFPPYLVHNTNTLFSTRTLVSLFSGAVAGVIGLENLWGFAFYLLTLLLHAVVVASLRCGGKPKDYFQHGWWDLLTIDQDGFLAFLLLWIGGYAVVHVYD
ncbi:hypothetical protein BDY24DRAFT_402280 [Mrakia frigida]|uniref:Emc6p n=1 Tax=Mrakia frigida TaxID=29902 RepID=UPI003FCBF147